MTFALGFAAGTITGVCGSAIFIARHLPTAVVLVNNTRDLIQEMKEEAERARAAEETHAGGAGRESIESTAEPEVAETP